MGNLARKIIEAVQNTMLDKLVLRSLLLGWVASAWDRLQPGSGPGISLVLLVGVTGLLGLAWGLGVVAGRRPRSRNPYDLAHRGSTGGFDAWAEPPRGGLHPPRFMRSVVMTLGVGGSSPWITLLSFTVFCGTMALLVALSHPQGEFWHDVSPYLPDRLTQPRLFQISAAMLVVLCIRVWAVEQRDRLVPTPAPSVGSAWIGWMFSILFLCFLFSTLALFFQFPYWSGVAAAAVLGLVAVAPPWRDRVLNAVFGKREAPAP